jgi:hypothetical protein
MGSDRLHDGKGALNSSPQAVFPVAGSSRCFSPLAETHTGLAAAATLGCYPGGMCRNITPLRGLEPPATPEEVEAAARQFVRKVSGVTTRSATTEPVFEQAVTAVARATSELLAALPPRRQPPATLPPLRCLRQQAT